MNALLKKDTRSLAEWLMKRVSQLLTLININEILFKDIKRLRF